MGIDDNNQTMRHPRPSDIRRHGFGSPEGMELTDMPIRRPAIETEGETTALTPTGALSPLGMEEMSEKQGQAVKLTSKSTTNPDLKATQIVTPPSATSKTLSATPDDDEISKPSPTQLPQEEEENPKKLRKRRLFFTPSRRKTKNTPSKSSGSGRNPNRPQQQIMTTMPSPVSPGIPQDRTSPPSTTSRPTDVPRPTSQSLVSAPLRSSNRPSSGSRRRQTGAPRPSGLSEYSTPRSRTRRQPQSPSGRRSFNPLEQISGLFNPQSPNFSPASPIIQDVPDDGFSDSSFSEESYSESITRPFVEQVESLSQLLATPSPQLGTLALTTDDTGYGSDDDLDNEMESIEASQRLLAEELSSVDFSSIGGFSSGSQQTLEATDNNEEKTMAFAPWPLSEQKIGSITDQPEDGTKNRGRNALPPTENFISDVPDSPIASKDPTVYFREEFHSEADKTQLSGDGDGDEEEEDKKPVAKDYSTPERKKTPPGQERKDTQPKFGAKKYSPPYTPPRPFPGASRENRKNVGEKKYFPPYTPPRPLSAEKQEFDQQAETSDKSIASMSANPIQRSVDSSEDTSLFTSEMIDYESNLSDKSPKEAISAQSISFDPCNFAPSRGAQLLSSVSDLGEGSISPPSSAGTDEDIFNSFLSFAKRFTGDGRKLASDLTPTKNIQHPQRVLEHLNTIFPTTDNEAINAAEENLPDQIEVPTNATRIKKKEKEIFVTPPRAGEPAKEKGKREDILVHPPRSREPVNEMTFESVPPSQDTNQRLTGTEIREQNLVLGKSTTAELTTQSVKETEAVSDEKESKTSMYRDIPAMISFCSDDSNDEVVVQKDSQPSIGSAEIDAPSPSESQIEPSEQKARTKSVKEKRRHTSIASNLSTKKRWLLIFGIILFVTGIGLVIGTTLFPNVEETPAPSTSSVTDIPTQEAKPAPVSLAPMPSFSPIGISSTPSFHPSEQMPVPSFPPSKISTISPSFQPSTGKPMPPRTTIPTPTTLPSVPPIPTENFLPSSKPSVSPSVSTQKPSTSIPPTLPSESSFDPTPLKESNFPSTAPPISPIPVPSIFPSPTPSTKSLSPSKAPSFSPSISRTETTEEPSTSPVQEISQSPTMTQIISFPITYEIFILNGLVDSVPESEYVPDLTLSMDLLTDDVLLNIASATNTDESMEIEVLLPTSIIEVTDTECGNGFENIQTSLCQEVIAEISLLNAKDSWQQFKFTTELAIEIGRLQFYLNRVNENSPAEIIDSLWKSPDQGIPAEGPVESPSSSIPIPVAAQLIPTPRPSFIRTPFSLFDLLESNSFDGGKSLNDTLSPQYRAYSWLRDDERIAEYSDEQMLQRYAMATLYYATNGDKWLNNTLWMSDAPECTWFGKTGSNDRCDQNGQLLRLELDLNNLSGSLPPELGLLSSALATITITGGPDSKLSGSLPTELGYLTRLRTFVVQNNGLSGKIPSEVENWRTLTRIDLSQNGFNGELPTQIGSLSDLMFFEVSKNELSGSLPSEIGQLRKCQKMLFDGNAFVSSIPTEIGGLTELRTLDGGSNLFDSLPTELGMLKSVHFIAFQNSSITGPIPTELGNLRNLRQLKLEYNDLSGSIPSELALVQSLQKINLSHNQLSGPLPTELGSLVDLRIIKFSHNRLSGVLPSEISQMSKLTSIQLNSNDFSGSIPSAVCGTFNVTYPSFQADCGDFDDNCPCCTICCVEKACTCRYLGTPNEFLCFQNK